MSVCQLSSEQICLQNESSSTCTAEDGKLPEAMEVGPVSILVPAGNLLFCCLHLLSNNN